MKRKKLVATLFLSGLITLSPAHAGEREELETLRETTRALIDALVEKGIIAREVAEAMVRQAEQKGRERAAAADKAEAAPGVVRVPYIPETVKREIREQIRGEVMAQAKSEGWGDMNAVPEWVRGLKWEGDLRVRYQGDYFADGNAPPAFFQASGVDLDNTTEDRNRWRVRARLGLLAQINDTISGGFRITTGNTSDPVSTNQTLGTTANKYSLVLDRAYARLTPWRWLTAYAGRLPNPFFSTDLVWDDDVNFEGLAATFKPWSDSNRDAQPFFTVGAFPLQEVESSPTNAARDKWLYAAQAGLDWKMGNNTRWRFGLAYYDYRNMAGVQNPTLDSEIYNSTAPQFRQKGNSVFNIDNDGDPATNLWALAANYRLANLTAAVDLAHFAPVHVILSGDVVKNIGYDDKEVASRMGADYQKRTLGYMGKFTLGMPVVKNEDDWQVFLGYKYLERDATLDAFTDSDFRLGGTDSKGYFLGGLYGIGNNASVGLKWLSADAIDGLPFSVDVLQVDLNAKF